MLRQGIACLTYSFLSISSLCSAPSIGLSSPPTVPLKSFYTPPPFPLPDNTKGTLSSSQLDSVDSSRVSGKHQTWDSFGGDHRSGWLYGYRDQPSPLRIRAHTHTPRHTHSHTQTPPLSAVVLNPLLRCQAEALDLPLPVILQGRGLQPDVLECQPAKQEHIRTNGPGDR